MANIIVKTLAEVLVLSVLALAKKQVRQGLISKCILILDV